MSNCMCGGEVIKCVVKTSCPEVAKLVSDYRYCLNCGLTFDALEEKPQLISRTYLYEMYDFRSNEHRVVDLCVYQNEQGRFAVQEWTNNDGTIYSSMKVRLWT